jgi:divalent metal cation (Fe/Co/Zn/Cd) transporter
MILQWLTIAHGGLETIVALGAGVAAGSVVLFGFGLDSLVEVMSALVVLWRLSLQSNKSRREGADAVGVRFVGVCFLVLAAYVAYDSATALLHHEIPGESVPGILLASFSVIAMPLLARAKRRIAFEIGSSAMSADSIQSDLCAYLSGILLIGLALNALLGWWWADPIAALAMVPIIGREGFQAIRGRACGCSGCCSASQPGWELISRKAIPTEE